MKVSELIWKLQQLSFDKKEDSEVFVFGQEVVDVEYNDYFDYYGILTNNKLNN